jgi:hypothetical protein
MVRRVTPLALAAGLWFASFASAQSIPTPTGGSPDQQLAVKVATKLGESAMYPGMQVDILCVDGQVELTGQVRETAQAADIAAKVRSVPGVRGVNSKLTVAAPAVRQAQATDVLPPPAPAPGVVAPPAAPLPGPVAPGAPLSYDVAPPKMPSYAWPTYAPYNNYARVGYPLAYPYNAFPFIGPFYPFPKVPLGWRKVTLEWEDGHWFIGKNAGCQDYWRVRYW